MKTVFIFLLFVSTAFSQTVVKPQNGGTGQTSLVAAITAMLPTQAGQNGKVLGTNGSILSWVTGGGGGGTVTSIVAGSGLTGGTITTSGTIAIDLANANIWSALQTFPHTTAQGNEFIAAANSGNTTINAARIATLNQNTTGTSASFTGNLTGPVTSTGMVTAIANSAITNAMLANGAVANLSGTNTGDQTITLTGNVTGSGTGSFATTIANLAVTNAMIASGAIDLTAKVTGTLPGGNGGIGTATLASYGVLYGNSTSAIQALAVNSTATNKFLTQSSNAAPAWNTIVAGDVPTLNQSTTGNAATATNVAFSGITTGTNAVALHVGTSGSLDATGSGTITATATPASGITGTTLASGVVSSSLTSVGTIATGVWNGTKLSEAYGGTNQSTYTTGDILYASASNTLSKLGASTAGQVLTTNGAGAAPTWTNPTSAGVATYMASPANTANVNNATGVMLGLAGSITPLSGGPILILINGTTNVNTVTAVKIRYGAGTAPAFGDALTGTVVGNLTKGSNNNEAWTLVGVVTGLTIGTAYWIDLSMATSANSQAQNLNITAVETAGGVGLQMASPLTTTGDIIYSSNNSGAASRLGIGSTSQLLTVTGGIPAWTTSTYPSTYATGDLPYASATNVVGKLPIGGIGTVLTVVGGLPSYTAPTKYQASPSNPTGTTSATGLMMGLAGSITCVGSGIVLITVTGDLNSGATGAPVVQLRHGTGSAPANGDALTGTAVGSAVAESGLASASVPFTCTAIVSGLTLAAHWIDVSLKSDATSSATVTNLSISAYELK